MEEAAGELNPLSSAPESNKRNSSIFRTAASSVVLRAVSLGCTLIQVPLVLPFLGEEFFGFWGVLMVIGGFFGLSDMGISSAFQNDVTVALSRGETARLRAMFLTAQITLFAFALSMSAVLVAIAVTVGRWTFFRDLPPLLSAHLGLYAFVYFAVGACNVPLSLSGKLAFGVHRGYLSNLATVGAQVVTLAAMGAAVWSRAPFEIFLLAASVPTLLTNLVLAVLLFRDLEPSQTGRFAGFAYARHTIRSGLPFLALSISTPAFFAVGPLVLSSTLGLGAVTAFNLLTRALGIIHNVEAGVLNAFWPALTEAVAKRNLPWAWTSIRRSMAYTIGFFCLPALLFPVFGPRLLSAWSKLPPENFPPWITWPLTLLYIGVFFSGPVYVALNAAGSVNVLALGYLAAAVAALAFGYLSKGTPMLFPWCLALAFALFGIAPPFIRMLQIFRPRSAA